MTPVAAVQVTSGRAGQARTSPAPGGGDSSSSRPSALGLFQKDSQESTSFGATDRGRVPTPSLPSPMDGD